MRRVLALSAVVFYFAASASAQSSKTVAKAPAPRTAAASQASPAAAAAARASFARLPLSFEENAGQTDARVKYTSRGAGYSLFLTNDEAVVALSGASPNSNCTAATRKFHPQCTGTSNNRQEAAALWLKFLGANPSAQLQATDPLPGRINYYIGNDPSKWRAGVRQFGRVNYKGIYPGVDLTYYGNQEQLESDFVVAPGSNPRSVEFEVTGAQKMRLDGQGNLVLTTAVGEAHLLRPGVYQVVNGARRDLPGRYVLRGKNRIGFEVGRYDNRNALVIDPILTYSTYLGGSGGDTGNAVTIDASGDAYVTGMGNSLDFPGAAIAGPVSQTEAYAFVTVFNPSGNSLVYSTLLRGTTSFNDSGNGIGLDSSGNAYVAGITGDADFPLLNPFQATIGDDPIQSNGGFIQSGFVAALDPTGALIYSTFFGGRNDGDQNTLTALAADASGNAYVTGYTTSQNFPTLLPLPSQSTLNGFQNAVVAKFTNQGQLVYSTYLGGNSEDQGNAIAVDSSGNAYVTGSTFSSNFPVQTSPAPFQATQNNFSEDAFVSKINFNSGTQVLTLMNSTYLGGEGTDIGYGIAVDTASPPNVYLTGDTSSTGTTNPFPTQNPIFAPHSGATEAFVTKMNGTFTALVYSTFLGGSSSLDDAGHAIALDGANPPDAFVTGDTNSTDFPVVAPLQSTIGSTTASDAFVTEINGAGSAVEYSTFLGGLQADTGLGIAVDGSGNAYVTGSTLSANFPVLSSSGVSTAPFQLFLRSSSGNAFLTKIAPGAGSTLQLFPPMYTYPATGINDTGLLETFTLSNYSGASVTINAPSISGTDPGDFTIVTASSTCTAALVLASGSSCVIAVRFVPQDQDARSATLTVTTTSSATASANLSGFGAVPEISLIPATINYGTSMPLNVQAFGSLEITNTGGGTLHVGSIQITNAGSDAAAYTIAENTCATVPAHSTCFLEVNLTPTAAKAYSATLLINSNAFGSPTSVAISGTAVAQVTVSPTSLEFGGQLLNTATSDNEITVLNGSGGVITLSSIVESGSSGDFPVDTSAPNTSVPTCVAGIQLQPGVSCAIYMFFRPTKGTALDGDTATFTFNWTGTLSGSKAATVMGTGETGVVLYQTTYTAPSEFVGAAERQAGFDQIFNGTSSPIQITGIVLSGSTPQDFTVELDNSCSVNGTIPANSICFLDGQFAPTATGTRSVTATISYTPPSGSTLTLNASGIGLAGPVTFPSSFDFGTQIVGLQGTVQRLYLQNTQRTPLQITTVSAVSGTNAADFVVQATSTCKSSTTVAAGGKCFLEIQFTPGAAGSRSASLTITDNGPGSPRTLNMTGTGEAPAVTVTPTTLDFGNQALVNPSAAQPTVTATIYVTNAGNSSTTISVAPALTTGGTPFAIASGAGTTCVAAAVILPQGGTCSIAVTFKPSATGQVTNSLTLTDSVGGLHTVTVQGTGVDQGALSASAALAFNQAPSTTSSAQTVTITNTGTGPLTITAIGINGTNPNDFAIPTTGTTCAAGNSLPAAPGPGNTCTIAVTFTAPATAGSFSANLLVKATLGNNASGTSSTALTGSSQGLSISPSTTPYNFGTVPVGTAIDFSTLINSFTGVTLTNNFASAVNITSVAPQTAGDFTVINSDCSGSLSAGNQCTFDIAFTPSVTTTESNNILVTYTGGPSSPLSIAVTGTGSAALVAVPNPLNVTTAVGLAISPTITVGNGTSSTINIVSVNAITGTSAADYTLSSFGSCSFIGTLTAASNPAGSSCTVSLTFNPTAPGTNLNAQFTITYTVGASTTQQNLTVNLSGTATAAQVSIAPSPVNFGNQLSNTQSLVSSVVVTNTGNAPLNVTNLAITGTNANDFALAAESDGFGIFGSTSSNIGCQNEFSGLAPSASCTIPITFTPTLLYTGTSRSALLTITDNAYPKTTQTVILEGNAPAGSVAVSPTTLSFPNTNVGSSGTETVLVSNNTNAAVTFTNSPNFVTFGTTSYGVDTTQTLNACAQSTKLSAFTGSCTLYIKFDPASAGSIPDTATIHTSGGTPTVTLSGTGLSTTPTAPTITSANVTTFAVGTAGSFTVTATGFPTPTFGESGALPSGVTFNTGTGLLSGTPGAGTGGTYSITFTASNGVAPNAVQSFTLTVHQSAVITSASSTTFTVGSAGTFTVTATGVPAASLSESGTLPSGVTFNTSTGALSGTPAAGTGGTYNITFTATNGVGSPATQSFTLTVDQAPAITSANSVTFTVGVAGSFTVVATGTPAPALNETGALPSGVTFNTSTGALSGTPGAGTAGTYNLTFKAHNGVGSDASQSFTLTVNPTPVAPSITSANNTTFTVGAAGSFTVTATGSPTPTLSESGALPSGVTFNTSTGALSGTPAAGTAGTYNLTFTASNGVASNAVQSFTLTVNQTAAITSTNSTTFSVGTAGTFTVTATGSPAPALSESGALPTGVTFNTGTGVLSGTPAAGSGGTYNITVTATNGVGSPATQSFTLTVDQTVAITSANSTTFLVGAAGSFTVTATGFPAPALSESGALPSGVTFNTGTGALSGTPAAGSAGTYNLTFTATNGVGSPANQSFTLTVNQTAAITSANSTTFLVGTAGSFTVTATGFPAPALSESGALPSGVTFNTSTGALFGTPAAGSGGTYHLTFTATNGVGSPAAQSFTLTVNQTAAITSANSTTFLVGTAGSFTVTATGFPAPALSESGALPSGVTFNTGTGVLSGTPAAGSGGTYNLTFTATNGIGTPATQSFTLTVDQSAAITSPNAVSYTVGVAGTFSVAATGFPAPTLSETGSLPSGVTFTAGTGVLAGTPAAGTAGTYNLTFKAHNGVGSDASQSFTLTVTNVPVPPSFTSANTSTFTVAAAGTFTVTANGSPIPTLSESGALPSGVTFVDNGNGTGTLSGTAAAGTAGTYNITLTARNTSGPNATQSFTLVVDQTAAITSASSTTFTVGAAGSFTVTATGSPAPTLSESGALPSGVTFNTATGVLSGTPAAGTGGTYNITFTASNGVSTNATQNFTLTVDQSAAITSANNATFTVGAAGSLTVTATGFPVPALSESGALPSGVTFNSATGALSGTPAAGTAGTYNLTFTATNGVGSPATQSFTLTVNQVAAISSASSTTFTVGAAGTFTVTASGSPTPTLSESGALPSGVTFNASTGVLSGTPATGTGGTYNLTFTATNGVGSPGTQSFTLTVDQSTAITSANNTTFLAGTAGSFTVTATGFPTPTLSESGALPSGVTFTPGTGALAGTPAAGSGGTYNITFTATNGVGSPASQSFTLTVNQSAAITSANSATFTVSKAGTFTVTATGFPAPTLNESGTLPSGVTFNAGTGVLSGTPAASTAGTYNLTFTAHNGIGTDATQSFTLTVDVAPAVTTNPANQTVSVGANATFTAAASGTPAPTVQWQVSTDGGNTYTNVSGATSTTLTFAATATQNGNKYQAVFTNSVGTATTTAATLTVIAPDVTLSETHTGDFVVGGLSDVYTFKATNNGTGPTTGNVVVTDTLPAGLTLVSNTGTGWACAAGSQTPQVTTCTYTGAALAAAGSSIFTVTVSVAPSAFPSVTNTATVSDPNDSKTSDKNSAPDVTNIDNAVPTETSFTPTGGLIVGTGLTAAQTITLTGTGFNSSTQVTIGGGSPITGTANAAGTSLTLTVPASALATPGNATIAVTNPKNPTSNLGGGAAPSTLTFPLVGISAAQDTSTAGTITVTAGTPAMVKIDYTTNPANSALPGSLTVTCALPQSLTGATCAIGTPMIAAGATSGSSTITINAIPMKSSGSSTPAPSSGGRGPRTTYSLWLFAAVLLSMLGMWASARQRMLPLRRVPAYLGLVLLVLAAGALVGCTTANSGPTPTPVGPSTMTVTATAADGTTVTTTVNITIAN